VFLPHVVILYISIYNECLDMKEQYNLYDSESAKHLGFGWEKKHFMAVAET